MAANLMDLTGRVAVITGGGRGIGRETARVLAGAGAHIAIAELDPATGEDAAAEIRALGRDAIAVPTNVRSSANVDAMAAEVMEHFGRIDILVSNAGIAHCVAAEETGDDEWLRVIDIDLNGVFWSCRAVGRYMIQQKVGVIVNIASMSGVIVNKPQPQAAYNAAKAGVIHLTKSLAAEWAPHGIRVNAVSPGYVATEMTLGSYHNFPDWAKTWHFMSPMDRIATPMEIAQAVYFLASDASSFTTGSNLLVDGGYTTW